MISVVIPARNAASTLAECLEALAVQTVPSERFEVIVVDDGSTDLTASIARTHGATCIPASPSGAAAARNRGVAEARGDLVLFTDSDCAPAPDWIERLAAPFADPGVVGAKGVYRTRERGAVPRFVQAEYEDKYARMARRDSIDFVDTYSAAYRRDVFLENGGFETAFPGASVEDQEFSFRLAEKGYRLVFAPGAAVYHRHDRTLADYARRKFWIGYWKTFLLRWHPEKALSDSHTPFSQRAQLILLAAAVPLATAGAVFAPAAWAALGALILFFLSALPFMVRSVRKDPALALAAPVLLLVRAGALGAGLAAGLVGLRSRPSPRRAALGWAPLMIKRAMDVVVSALALTLSLPAIVLLAVLIRLGSPGPAFFVQERVGENGRRFRLIKLRTMVDGADAMFDEVAAGNPLPGPAVKLPKDPRVTRLGAVLRRWSLDELPQFWNVLVGDMSLVGPRPEQARVVEKYNDWHRLRLAVKPGLTGPAQVNGRGELPLDERVRLELDYIERYSVWKDLAIIARTLPAVCSGRGAY